MSKEIQNSAVNMYDCHLMGTNSQSEIFCFLPSNSMEKSKINNFPCSVFGESQALFLVYPAR